MTLVMLRPAPDVQPAVYRLAVGRRVPLTLTAVDKRGNPALVPAASFASSSSKAVTLTAASGQVLATAVAEGVALVTASVGGLQAMLLIDTRTPAIRATIEPSHARLSA